MSVKKLVLLSSMAIMLSAPAFAEKGSDDTGHHGGKMEALDTNGDGMISKDEFMDAHIKRFEKMDSNSDGNVSMDEIKAYRDLKRAERAEKKAGDSEASSSEAAEPEVSTPEGEAKSDQAAPAELAPEGEAKSDQAAPAEKPAQ